MKSLLLACALLFVSGAAFAGSTPLVLNDRQMDTVTAGFDTREIEITNTSWTAVVVNEPAVTCPNACYLNIVDRWPSGAVFMQIASQFGPPAM